MAPASVSSSTSRASETVSLCSSLIPKPPLRTFFSLPIASSHKADGIAVRYVCSAFASADSGVATMPASASLYRCSRCPFSDHTVVPGGLAATAIPALPPGGVLTGCIAVRFIMTSMWSLLKGPGLLRHPQSGRPARLAAPLCSVAKAGLIQNPSMRELVCPDT